MFSIPIFIYIQLLLQPNQEMDVRIPPPSLPSRLMLEDTKQLQNSQTYIKYMQWLEMNGVIISDKLLFPAIFQPGIKGVGARRPICANQAVIAVPYHLIINAQNIQKDKQIQRIVNEHRMIFDPNMGNELAIMLLFLCREYAHGQKSFYAPYLNVCLDNKREYWTYWDMLALQDSEVMKQMKREQQRVSIFFSVFIKIFRKQKDIFPIEISDAQYKAILQNSFYIITTRSFGWPLPQRSLVPMADALNHSNQKYATHMVIKKESQNPKLQKYNLKILGKQSPQLEQPKKGTKRERFIQKHKQHFQDKPEISMKDQESQHHYILWLQYNNGRTFNHLHYYDNSCDEDNDTDEEDQEQFDARIRKFEQDDRKNDKTMTQQNKLKFLIDYWTIYSEDISSQKSSQVKIQASESSSEQQVDGIRQKQKTFSSESMSSTSSDSFEQQFEQCSNKIEKIPDRYFLMVTKNEIQENQELFTFYGRRSNRFLLLGYDFILESNKYDSYAFRMILKNWKNDPKALCQPVQPYMCIARSNSPNNLILTKEIRLKKQKINLGLVNHCRALLLGWQNLSHWQQAEPEGAFRVTVPLCKKFQAKVLQLATEILLNIRAEFMTGIEQDREMLTKCSKYSLQCAIKLRIIHKQIVSRQIQMLRLCGYCLEGWSEGKIVVQDWRNMGRLGPIRDYLVCLEASTI